VSSGGCLFLFLMQLPLLKSSWHPWLAPFSDKRKCLYAEDGYVEELSLAELQELRELESKSLSNKPAHIEPKVSSFGSVGHKFSKQFPDGRWFDGVVVEVLTNVGKFSITSNVLFSYIH